MSCVSTLSRWWQIYSILDRSRNSLQVCFQYKPVTTDVMIGLGDDLSKMLGDIRSILTVEDDDDPIAVTNIYRFSLWTLVGQDLPYEYIAHELPDITTILCRILEKADYLSSNLTLVSDALRVRTSQICFWHRSIHQE